MSPQEATAAGTPQELDVRGMRKPDKHPTIFAAYADLPVGASFVLVNDHDPKHLHDEFEVDHAGSYEWEYLNTEPRDWRIRITKLTSAPLPRVLVDTTALTDQDSSPDVTGAVWRLQVRDRDLDSDIIALPPHGVIETHTGPDLDVMVHVLAGSGELKTERGEVGLEPGALLWLPRRAPRRVTAGADGLRYLSIHQRRQGLTLGTSIGPGGAR